MAAHLTPKYCFPVGPLRGEGGHHRPHHERGHPGRGGQGGGHQPRDCLRQGGVLEAGAARQLRHGGLTL